jgi:hypothetical protein
MGFKYLVLKTHYVGFFQPKVNLSESFEFGITGTKEECRKYIEDLNGACGVCVIPIIDGEQFMKNIDQYA